ncbi:MAG: hypothetical protein QW136_00490, partial [Nitrososphaerales archaeon]
TLAHVNGINNICRYGVAYAESALSSGCQFRRRGGVPPVPADLPEEGEWSLWKTSTDNIHTFVVRDSGIIVPIGGYKRQLRSGDLTLTTSFQNVFADETFAGGRIYLVRSVLFLFVGLSALSRTVTLRFSGTLVASSIRSSMTFTSNNTPADGFMVNTFNSDMVIDIPSTSSDTFGAIYLECVVSVSTTGTFNIQANISGAAFSGSIAQHSWMEISRV